MYAEAIGALNTGDFERAYRLASVLTGHAPGHGGPLFVAGVAALHLKLLPQAVALLDRACTASPGRPDYHAQHARALATVRAFRESLDAADRAIAAGPNDALTLDTVGIVYTQGNEHAKAVNAYRRAIELAPRTASFRFNLATSLTFVGDLDGAAREYETCVGLDPRYWKAHLALAQLRRQSATSNHVDRLEPLLAQSGPDPQAQLYLNLALAKEYEDLGSYGDAFRHLSAGKRAGLLGRAYDFGRDEALFAAIESLFQGSVDGAAGCASTEPIFVVGMPRSGTTLVDRILSSHPDVHSAGELQNFGVVAKRLSGSRTPQILDVETLRRAYDVPPSKLGEAYVASTRPGTSSRRRFTDKLPHNFLYAGFIARALPDARIVCLLRDPLDTCLGNFRQLFALSSPYYDYSFDLVATARYYVLFHRLIEHWQRILPNFHIVQYESLVANQQAVTESLLAYCGLRWDERCLAFENNQAPVATASAVQVREPLNVKSIGRWKSYAVEMEPARRILVDAGIVAG